MGVCSSVVLSMTAGIWIKNISVQNFVDRYKYFILCVDSGNIRKVTSPVGLFREIWR